MTPYPPPAPSEASTVVSLLFLNSVMIDKSEPLLSVVDIAKPDPAVHVSGPSVANTPRVALFTSENAPNVTDGAVPDSPCGFTADCTFGLLVLAPCNVSTAHTIEVCD